MPLLGELNDAIVRLPLREFYNAHGLPLTEHHLRPQAHWRDIPGIRIRHAELLSSLPRVVSPVPALLGFLHRSRSLLHRAAPPLELGRPRPATSPLDRA